MFPLSTRRRGNRLRPVRNYHARQSERFHGGRDLPFCGDIEMRCALVPGVPLILASDLHALLRSRRLHGVELPVAHLDAASPLLPGNRRADMVRASPSARDCNFLLRFAGCQGKDLIAQAR